MLRGSVVLHTVITLKYSAVKHRCEQKYRIKVASQARPAQSFLSSQMSPRNTTRPETIAIWKTFMTQVGDIGNQENKYYKYKQKDLTSKDPL